jgi:hypothetical protein
MWRRNYQPLPQDKSEGYHNDAERWDLHIILFLFSRPTVLIFPPGHLKQKGQDTLILWVPHNRSLHGSRQHPPYLLVSTTLGLFPADPATLEIPSTIDSVYHNDIMENP